MGSKPRERLGPSVLSLLPPRCLVTWRLGGHASPSPPSPGVPGLSHLGVDVEGQDEEGEQQIGHGEADDEVVGGGLERPLRADAQTDEPVAADDEEDEEDAEHQGGDAVAGYGGRGSGGAVAHGPAALPPQPRARSRAGRRELPAEPREEPPPPPRPAPVPAPRGQLGHQAA